MAVFTDEDMAFYEENGYVVLREAISLEQAVRTRNAIDSFLGGGGPDTWYKPPFNPGGFISMYHHPVLWENRQNPQIYDAFKQIIGTGRLWATLDRVSMKLPPKPGDDVWQSNGFLHWDWNVHKTPVPKTRVQGVLSLADTPAGGGAFQCIPGSHRRLKEILSTRPRDDWDPMVPDQNRDLLDQAVPIPTQAGDLVIWTVGLAHGSGPNRSDKARYAQYLSMFDPDEVNQSREERIAIFRERHGSGGFPADDRRWEARHTPVAQLSDLGRRLLGLDAWPN